MAGGGDLATAPLAPAKPGHETVEPQEWSQGRIFPGAVSIEGESEALYMAQNWDEAGYDTIWTDCSRLDSGRIGAACAWQTAQEPEVWTGKRLFLGDSKEVSTRKFSRSSRPLGFSTSEGSPEKSTRSFPTASRPFKEPGRTS